MSERVHHVWVRPVHVPTEMPGLVLEWRRNGPDWQALVTYVEPHGVTITAVADSVRSLRGVWVQLSWATLPR